MTEQVRALPQTTCMETEHFLAGGMYGRKVWRPAGTVIVGRVHKTEHFSILLSGELLVSDGETRTYREAPDVWVSPVGTQRATFALTDAEFMTVHRLPDGVTKMEDLEEVLLEPDESANYDILGKLKDPALAAPVKLLLLENKSL